MADPDSRALLLVDQGVLCEIVLTLDCQVMFADLARCEVTPATSLGEIKQRATLGLKIRQVTVPEFERIATALGWRKRRPKVPRKKKPEADA